MTILEDICQEKRTHIQRMRSEYSEAARLREANEQPPPRGFARALHTTAQTGQPALIAEIKKASPSKGIIRQDFHPAKLAEAYAQGGATCLSVLTDTPYFQGEDAYLHQARAACALPALRKDFMLEPYQIIESRALSADCVLLIMAALSNDQAAELFAAAGDMGLDALIEVHDRAELDRALTHLPGATMIGVNNRSLHSFVTDLSISESLANHIPSAILSVSESGIHTHEDITRLQTAGYGSFLVGESLMRQADVAAATSTLLNKG